MKVYPRVILATLFASLAFAQHAHHGAGDAAGQKVWPRLPIPAPLACHFKGVVSHIFFGKPSQVLHEMKAIEDRLAGSATGRVYMMVIEGAGAAQVFYFERMEGGDIVRVSWRGDSAAELRSQLEAEILESRGRRCAGQQMREKVLALGGVKAETLALPELTKANHLELTLAPLVASNDQDQYMRVTIFYPC